MVRSGSFNHETSTTPPDLELRPIKIPTPIHRRDFSNPESKDGVRLPHGPAAANWPVAIARCVNCVTPQYGRMTRSIADAGYFHSWTKAVNKVPMYQRMYQAAYRQHTRIWKIVSERPDVLGLCGRLVTDDGNAQHPRSNWYLRPYYVLLWGTAGGSSLFCFLYSWSGVLI
jgi:hypothetical protein